MTIELNIDDVFDKMREDIVKISKRALPVVTRQALNRTIRDMNVEMKRRVRDKLNLKLSDINRKKMVIAKNASGTNIGRMDASLTMSGRSISLINFIRNPKPTRQGFIPVAKRKPVKIKVGSSVTVLKTAFIQRGKKNKNGEGNLHVFKRVGGRTYWKRQAAPSLAALSEREDINRPMRMLAQTNFEKNFKQRLDYELSKIGRNKR